MGRRRRCWIFFIEGVCSAAGAGVTVMTEGGPLLRWLFLSWALLLLRLLVLVNGRS